MRTFCGALLIVHALLVPAQQPDVPRSNLSGKLSIPAQLAHTVRADKVHPGDPVEFKTISAVLIGKGLVMPADAHLYGRVLSVGQKQDNKNSYLAVVVERAEWREHSLPLRAFISAQITMKPANLTTTNADAPPDQPSPRRAGRMSARAAAGNDPSIPGLIKAPQDATDTPAAQSVSKYPMLEDVGIFRDKNGTTYLLSAKSNVKLPAGVLLMLQNEPGESAGTTSAKPATSTTASQPY
jgi:hypothetical protein